MFGRVKIRTNAGNPFDETIHYSLIDMYLLTFVDADVLHKILKILQGEERGKRHDSNAYSRVKIPLVKESWTQGVGWNL